jgi:hypothetical protein
VGEVLSEAHQAPPIPLSTNPCRHAVTVGILDTARRGHAVARQGVVRVGRICDVDPRKGAQTRWGLRARWGTARSRQEGEGSVGPTQLLERSAMSRTLLEFATVLANMTGRELSSARRSAGVPNSLSRRRQQFPSLRIIERVRVSTASSNCTTARIDGLSGTCGPKGCESSVSPSRTGLGIKKHGSIIAHGLSSA